MKIVRKISLKRGLNRYLQPSPHYPQFTRSSYNKQHQRDITVNEQLHKYGIRPKYNLMKFYLCSFFGGIFALTLTLYLNQLYRNQKDTIYRYRYHENQVSNLRLRLRLMALKFLTFMEGNVFLSEFSRKQEMGKKTFVSFTQGFLRYGQYCHLMQNKERKFDFLDIGILQKFPYPKRDERNK